MWKTGLDCIYGQQVFLGYDDQLGVYTALIVSLLWWSMEVEIG